jgi:hypothetical protein
VPKTILSAFAIFAMACSSVAATPAKPHKRRHAATTASVAGSHKQPVAGAVKGSRAGARRKGTVTRGPSHYFQQAPTPDRYREIQQALASKGYLHSEPNGQWGAESSDALKRFQADQSLMPDGKINSLSLIALGLGPKRLTAKSEATPAPQPTAQPSVAPAPPPPNPQ